jgi:FkbM family methyltransferase
MFIYNLSKYLVRHKDGKVFSKLLSMLYKRKVSKARKTLKKLGDVEIKKNLDLKAIGVSANKSEIQLNPNDEGLSAQLLAYEFREPINCYLLSQFIKKENFDVIIDAGSNIGYFPIVELESGAKKVVVIEPVPETFRFLHKNIERYSNVSEVNAAVSVHDQEETLFIAAQKNLSTIIPDEDYLKIAKTSIIDKMTVQALTFQSIIDKVGINGQRALLRMDIEGYEGVIGYNLPDEIKAISLEFHRPVIGYEASMKLLDHWEESGFKAVTLSRELDGLSPFIKRFGLQWVLRIYELMAKRIFFNPDRNLINEILTLNKESPHICLLRD